MEKKTIEVVERYAPQLDAVHADQFNNLVRRIDAAFPHYRGQVVQRELDAIEDEGYKNLEALKYKVSISVLADLIQQGWELEVRDGELLLRLFTDETNDKSQVRSRLSSERKAQFQDESVMRFVERMEKQRPYHNESISIRNLIGNADTLIQRINAHAEQIVSPYIQLVCHEQDEHTGYWLSDIWRYFRYTWAIPYKTMPGRNLFYLVRDASQPYHPIIGIFALGNSVLNLTVRDDEIGWTSEAIAMQLSRREQVEHFSQQVSGTNGKTVGAVVRRYLETEQEYETRVESYAAITMDILKRNIQVAIGDLYTKDLGFHKNTRYPKQEKVEELRRLATELRDQAIDNKKTASVKSYKKEALEILFKKKRAEELARLLDATIIINKYKQDDDVLWLKKLISTEDGRKAVNVALVANRKTKIGSNMMEIIVCGAIPPYNELLGGKLVSILACSPQVISDYTNKYQSQVSEIASRMKGEKVIRDSRLAFLGTTSLYAIGSSQYNRINIPVSDDFNLRFKKMGITEGYGTVYFSKKTTSSMMQMLEKQDGGRKINNIFGEGTSPRFRLISRGLSSLGIRSDAFLQHYSPRIVFSIELANNTNEFLRGETNELEYPFDIHDPESIRVGTQALINGWEKRWLQSRLHSVDIVGRLQEFDPNSILVSTTR